MFASPFIQRINQRTGVEGVWHKKWIRDSKGQSEKRQTVQREVSLLLVTEGI